MYPSVAHVHWPSCACYADNKSQRSCDIHLYSDMLLVRFLPQFLCLQEGLPIFRWIQLPESLNNSIILSNDMCQVGKKDAFFMRDPNSVV